LPTAAAAVDVVVMEAAFDLAEERRTALVSSAQVASSWTVNSARRTVRV